MKLVKNENQKILNKVSDKEAEEAFVKIIEWIGENPAREGLKSTPKRLLKAFKELHENKSGFLVNKNNTINCNVLKILLKSIMSMSHILG